MHSNCEAKTPQHVLLQPYDMISGQVALKSVLRIPVFLFCNIL